MKFLTFIILATIIEFSIQGFLSSNLYRCEYSYARENMPCEQSAEKCFQEVPYEQQSYFQCSINFDDLFGPPHIWKKKWCPHQLEFNFDVQLCLPIPETGEYNR
uniref:Chitin-binding type-2 domain-containing protein n=1 Tax=Acrobeloides nanus TaxID=290746 RepID=A0A914CR36_9BILA